MRRRWAIALLGFGVALLVTGAVFPHVRTATAFGGYSREQLRALPEAGMVYPGGTVLAHYGHEARVGALRAQVATDGFGAAIPADSAAIEVWYDTTLRARGWVPLGNVGGTTAEVRADGWKRGTLLFRLSIRWPDDPRNVRTPTALTGQTLIDVFLIPDTPPR